MEDVMNKSEEETKKALENNARLRCKDMEKLAKRLGEEISDEEREEIYEKLDCLGVMIEKKVRFTISCGGCSTGDSYIEVTLDDENEPKSSVLAVHHWGQKAVKDLDEAAAEYYEDAAISHIEK